jgi:hypothetical protein
MILETIRRWTFLNRPWRTVSYLKDTVSDKGGDYKMPADTKDCAIACAKNGQPQALLTSDGQVYTIAGGFGGE